LGWKAEAVSLHGIETVPTKPARSRIAPSASYPSALLCPPRNQKPGDGRTDTQKAAAQEPSQPKHG